jgi:hypothetical protein
LDSKRIGQSTAPEMMATLVKIYMLIGLRQQNYPSDVETKMLCSYLLSNYSQKTLDELYLAFDLAVKDQLEYDLKVYDAFTIPILNGVMGAYKKWIYNESLKVQKPAALPPILQVTHEDKIKECDEWEQKKDIKLSLIPLYLYDWFVVTGRIDLTNEEKKVIYNKAAEYRLSQLQNETELDRTNRHEYKSFNQLLIDGIQNIKGVEQDRLRNLAKKIAVFEYLKNIKR